MAEYSTAETFDADVAGELVLVMFTSPSCVPCKVMSAWLDDLGVPAFKVDVMCDPGLAERFRVQSVPALFLFSCGELLAGRTGLVRSKEMLKSWVKKSGAR